MERKELKQLLEQVRNRSLGVDKAIASMRQAHVEQLEFAALDIHRAIRRGFPEVIYGPGKKPEQIVEIVGRVKNAMLAGNTYSALKRIESIGDKPEWAGGRLITPPVKIEHLSIVAR